jgi:prepilin-type N-terminal cleavage/methylation domain-containing protein
MKKNGYTITELLVVFAVLGIIVIATLVTTSYAFKDNSEDYYETKIHGIERVAVIYGQKSEALKNEKNLVITVNDLVKEGYVHADGEDGKVTDPRNSKGSLNSLKIKLTMNDKEEVEAQVIKE